MRVLGMSTGTGKKTKAAYLQDIVNDYIDDGQPWPADRRTIAAWAVSKKKWQPQPKSLIDRCAQDLAEAMRLEMEVDPQGRTVRAKHCAIVTEQDEEGQKHQKTLWFDRETATPELMRLSLQQRRKGILGDCKQIALDRDSYNDNNQHGAVVQISLNFEPDLAELQHDTEYNPPAPPAED